MRTLFYLAVALAAGVEAREPENLAALADEMAVLERVLGEAMKSELAGLVASRYDLPSLHGQTREHLERWVQHESVRTIETEYLVRQGILVSVQLSPMPSGRNIPSSLITTLARTAGTRWHGVVGSLEPDDFVELKRLVDELDQTQRKKPELFEAWHVELRDAAKTGSLSRPVDSGPVGLEISALNTRERELQTDVNKEVKRLRSQLIEPAHHGSTDDIHGALLQAVCDYAVLKSLPDGEHLTLKVSPLKSPQELSRTERQWIYYVLAKQDVVECRQGTIDAEELRHRAYAY